MPARDVVRWAVVVAYSVMWIGGIATRCLLTNTASPPWASPLFLLLSSAILALNGIGLRPILTFAIGGFVAEVIGVQTGIPFGRYSYSGVLGTAVGGVPLAISCAWVTLLAFTRDIAWAFTTTAWIAVVSGAALMTAVDLLIDPVATRILGYWHWNENGPYYGVPLTNFVGWFLVSAILLAIAGPPAAASRSAKLVGASIVCFFAFIAACAK